MAENKILMISDAESIQALINFASHELLEKAHNCTDPIDIEELKKQARSFKLYELEREIIEAWEVRQKELIAEMNFFWFEKLWPFKM